MLDLTRKARIAGVALIWLSCLPVDCVRADETEATEGAPPAGVDTSRWLCRLCPYPEGWYGTLEFGPASVSDESLKFGDYRGLEEEGGFPSLDGDLHYRGREGRYVDLYLQSLGLDSRQLTLRGGRQGRFEVRLGWREIPKFRGYGARTPFRDIGAGTLSLPPDWQPGPTTRNMPALDGSLRSLPLGLERRALDLGLTLKFGRRWSYEIDYRHEEKNGTRPFGAGVSLIQSAHLPVPVDFTTDQFNMGLSLSGERAHLRLGFVGSEFTNAHRSVTWQNPFTAPPGTETLQASLEPDNEFYQFNLAAAYAPNRRLRLSGRAAWGRMTQDEPFVPRYSLNPQFSDLPLPRLSLAGEVDSQSVHVAGKVSARLSGRLQLTARIKLDERDNDSPVDLYTPIITDFIPREPGPNLPYSFERKRYRLELSHRTFNWLRFSAGGEHERFGRTLQQVETTREDTGWGQVRLDPVDFAQLRVRVERAERDGSEYRILPNGGLIEHPLQRKFHLADRDREREVVEIDLVPVERMGVSLAWYASDDDYEASVIGLRESTERNLSIDLSYAFSERASVHAFATREDIESTIAGATSPAATPWRGTTDDRFRTWGLGATYRASDRLYVGFDYVVADSDGRVAVESGAGEAPFPGLETRLRNARAHLRYRISEQWSGKLYLEYERYDSEDWALDGLGVDGIPAILTFGTQSPDYDVLVLRLLASLRF